MSVSGECYAELPSDSWAAVWMVVANVMGHPGDVSALSQTCRAARTGVYNSTVWLRLCAGCDLVNVRDPRADYMRFVVVNRRFLLELSVLGLDELEVAYTIGPRRLTERSCPIASGIVKALGFARRRLQRTSWSLMEFAREFARDDGSEPVLYGTHHCVLRSHGVSDNELVGPAATALFATYAALRKPKESIVVVVDSSADFRMVETVCRELVPEALVLDWDCSSEKPDDDDDFSIPGFKQLRLINSSSIVLVDHPVFVEYCSLDTVLELEDVAVITTNSMQFTPSRSRRTPLHVDWQ